MPISAYIMLELILMVAGGADYNRSVIVLIRLRGDVRRGGGKF